VVQKIGADTQDQVSFSIFIISLTWVKEVAVCSPTFSTTGTLPNIFRMKPRLTILIFLICSMNANSQDLICGCDKKLDSPESQYKCVQTVFKNGAKIYWQWSCDSSWLTFENKGKYILRTCKEQRVHECERTGLNFLKEYPNYLLFIYKWISGCCTPPDLVFIDKENGKEIKRITNERFIWGNSDENYALYFSDTTFSKLIYLDHNTDYQYAINFKNRKVQSSAQSNQVLQLTDLFKNFKKKDGELTFDFKTSSGQVEKMTIKLK